ncbi:hypothetical protein [uncultured Dokdonia sp.]|uniref:hypothetical protein n=1 Tax=uncultured Dokdonia sp. TaxID=575653 RepID=UPI00260C9613|nr:hypothetical protein [uncultured Dokdonia sp.]
MKFIKGILLLSLGLALLYILSKANLIVGRNAFAIVNRYILHIDSLSPNLVKFRVLTEVLVQLTFVILGILIYKKWNKTLVFFIAILILYPIFFDLSNMISDSSCIKAWKNPEKLIWYLPIRIIVLLISFYFFAKIKDKITTLHLILLFIILILYQIIRPY